MPPAVSDIDESDVDMIDEIPAKKAKAAPAKSEDEDEDDDDEEAGDEEYNVEKILKHKSHKGQILYRIKWLGWDDEVDETWEPEENLQGAPEILRAYHMSIGGTPQPVKSAKKPATSAVKGKGKRAATEDESPAPSKKGRGRRSEGATNGNSQAEWPPVGTWEHDIREVSAIIEDEPDENTVVSKTKKNPKNLEGLVLWNDGRKTQHKMDILRLKCPSKLLDYYENHL